MNDANSKSNDGCGSKLKEPNGNKNEKKKRQRREIESLHQEMEVTGYAKGKTGHRQRKVPRDVSKIRTQKRKLLEAVDDRERAILGEEDEVTNDNEKDPEPRIIRKRLRGSKAATENNVIRGSLVFQTSRVSHWSKDASGDNDKNRNYNFSGVGNECDNEVDEEKEEGQYLNKEFIETDSKDQHVKGESLRSMSPPVISQKQGKSSRSGKSTKKRRKMYRLRNFQSFKMAQKHGDALSLHARGFHKLAIEKLKAVALAAPSAPQVYSSLGMVYEDMLKESRKRYQEEKTSISSGDIPIIQNKKQIKDTTNDKIPDPLLADQRIIATKAYGSHHVAAILCKKDFTLWVRAGDSAVDISNVHHDVITLPNLPKELRDYHMFEKRRWQNEALRDYGVADNLKPPGIDVPAKLALMHIELGQLSNALTILTDLKNNPGSDFQCSYRAWMLYSDLMLRLGHESIQWNKGIEKNENYMFRRWLRKFSKVFDWQERRLQALSLALEAAAGTSNTKDFLNWIRSRVAKESMKHEVHNAVQDGPKLSSNEQSLEVDESNNRETQLEKEKKIVELNQARELEAFDKTTTEINSSSKSEAAKVREAVRKQLLKSHDAAICTLLNEYNEKDQGVCSNNIEQEEKILGANADFLTLSGSIRQVCSIASELMKHLHGLQLYDGARLVGDSVSSYMKERARRYDKAMEAKQKADAWQQKVRDCPFLLGAYDDYSDSDNEDNSSYLSDEEILLNDEEESSIIISLRKGALPPELRVLYGLALIGEGGRNFIAAKCLEIIDDLEQERIEWVTEGDNETKISPDPYWFLFRRAMTEQLSRTGAYAFLADILRKTGREYEWALHFSPYFCRHLESLNQIGLTSELLRSRESHEITPNLSFRKNQLLKVIIASCKFDLESIDESKEKKRALQRSPALPRTKQIELVQNVLSFVENIIPWVWESNSNLPPICIEIVKIVSRCIQWVSSRVLKELPYSVLKNLIGQCTTIISFFCGNSIPELFDIDETSITSLPQSESFPLSSSWQPTEFRVLSICAYNFAIACNVSLFSGWESEEFTLKLLNRKYGRDKHFGVHIRGKRLVGSLPRKILSELKRQWDLVATALPNLPKLDFSEKLRIIQDSEWSQENISRKHGEVAFTKYAEEEALQLFLGFSAICFQLSMSETNKKVSNMSQQLALSILLPLSQFCLDETLWDSDIGEAAVTIAGYDEWHLLHGDNKYQPIDEKPQDSYKKRVRKTSRKMVDENVIDWIQGPKSPTLVDFIPIPHTELNRVWMQIERSNDKKIENTFRADAEEQMRRVHKATTDLRSCHTHFAAEKACLALSIALLEMAAVPSCCNFFDCIQQAASFASQAVKSGKSDIVYRQRLPEMAQCTAREALIVLGRADCLHSVYYPNEAAFLCGFVARVCRLHRNSKELVYEWNDQWKIVAIYCYNVSVMIFATVKNVLKQKMQEDFRGAWGRDIVDELEKGRRDGRSWVRSLSKNGSMNEPNENITNAVDAPLIDTEYYAKKSDAEVLLEESEIINGSETLNEQVLQLLQTDVGAADEDEDEISVDKIVQYSV